MTAAVITPRFDHGAHAAAQHGIARSHLWHGVELAHLVIEPGCQAGTPIMCPVRPQVHHRFPFHLCVLLGRPELELYQPNLISLCESEAGKPCPNHHLLIGHLDFFQSSNLDVANDALRTWRGQTADQIRADPAWQLKSQHRMKSWADMTDADKRDLRALMDHVFPPELVARAMIPKP